MATKTCLVIASILLICILINYNVDAKLKGVRSKKTKTEKSLLHRKVQPLTGDKQQPNRAEDGNKESGKKRAVGTGAGAGTGAGTGAGSETNSATDSATASNTGSESQTLTHTKVNTKIATSSNAKAGANANVAAKVKTYAHANTETKVTTDQQGPTVPTPQTRPTKPPRTTGKGGGESTPTPGTKVIVCQCPVPCPAPCPCPCPPPPPPPQIICPPPCPPPPPPPPPCPPPPPPPVPCPPPCVVPVVPCPPPPPPPPPCPPCPPMCPCDKRRYNQKLRSTRGKKGAKRKHHSRNTVAEAPDLNRAEPLRFGKAAVAADHHNCSIIGKDILMKGGHAVDAIIAVHHCVEVVNCHSTGLGGGGFMVVFDKASGNSSAFDFRETLPYGYRDEKDKTQGETILVPGVLRGIEAAHKKYGKLKWAELFQPAIKMARDGFRIHEALAKAIEKKKDYIMTNLGLRELFAPDGNILRLGDILRRPNLSRTYEKIANSSGADIFYKGDLAQIIVRDIREAGGVMSLQDLDRYRAIERPPLKTHVKGLQMLSTPPPGSGALISLMLKIMEGFNWTADSLSDQNAPLTYHDLVESMKFAYAPFTFLGDPNFTEHTDTVTKYMLDDTVAQNMFNRVDNVSHTVDYYGPYSSIDNNKENGTSHMSVVDQHGNAASMTTSINAYFGSKLVSRELGFIYNNELADFSEFWPNVYNLTKDQKQPGKRPGSKSSPIIFLDNKNVVKGVFGAAGGFFIPSCLSMTIANWLFFKDNLKVAVSRPRLHCQLFPPTVVYEPTFPAEFVPKLASFSHAYVTNSTYDVSGQLNAIMGVVQGIVREDDGKLAAECDYRKGGMPAGY